ncbi:peptidase M61 [Sandarakinorhabdus cyanobacteriorum]|uniref:Peptidase M61 n=1 Tax=Sandarakinorhabdus cyanobacteriorum TaxID=1981098 RepID=A0A255Z4B8_9SPHN|nr:M61 family metallopeptidase [Sandarakinorhabdus cyanobacteriorum]OYQ36306.1 peptidase M61 [Sandarakinorhabdus cyanobacteriorum]
MRAVLLLASALIAAPALAQRSLPQPLPIVDAIPAARDTPFPGTIKLHVDVTDTQRGVLRVAETIPVPAELAGKRMALLFPKWLPGKHAPRGEIEKLAGLEISAGGKPLMWKRDPLDVFAFWVEVPAGATALDVRFDFLSATDGPQGRIVVTSDMLNLQPNSVSLYPAGWFTRQIPVELSVTWPDGWQAGSAMREARRDGNRITYQVTDYEALVDSPFFAGRHFAKWDLGQNVTLNVVADEARFLKASDEQIGKHKALVSQAIKLFGTRQFDHYDLLLSLTEKMGGIGLEHHRSSENGVDTGYFTDWERGPGRRNLLPHEFTHSWNGKHRRGADLVTPDFRTPMRNSMLWVYEGQTQFWGYVLQARSGLVSVAETIDQIAGIAATLDNRPARGWRSLDDTTNDPIITPRAPKGWLSFQRSEDYYAEGMLVWLEVDGIIRRESKGLKSLDDFARRFFGTGDGDWGVKPYDFNGLVADLNAVQPYDWAGLLTTRLTEKASGAPLKGLEMLGWKLVYQDKPSSAFTDANRRHVNLMFSGGLLLGTNGKVEQVLWGSAAFDAGLVVGDMIIAVNEIPYSDDALRAAVTAAKGGTAPIRLLVKTDDRVRSVDWAWNGGLRYPRLERLAPLDAKNPTGLERLLTAK